MKNLIKLSVLSLAIILSDSSYVRAVEPPIVSVELVGKMEQGEKIKLLMNIESINSLYAADFSFKYNNEVIKVTSIEKGDLIGDESKNPIVVANKVDYSEGTVNYIFTCTGKNEGYKGTGTFLIINAEVLKETQLNIIKAEVLDYSKNDVVVKLKLVDKTVNYVDYAFKNFSMKASKDTSILQGNSSADDNTKITSKTNTNITTDLDTVNNKISNSDFSTNDTNTDIPKQDNKQIKNKNNNKSNEIIQNSEEVAEENEKQKENNILSSNTKEAKDEPILNGNNHNDDKASNYKLPILVSFPIILIVGIGIIYINKKHK